MTPARTKSETWGPAALEASRSARQQFQDRVAAGREQWIQANRYFYDRLKRLLRFIVEPGARVLEVRCQTGHLLAAVEPSYGVGVEISQKLIQIAQKNFPHLEFVQKQPEDLELNETFDYIIFSHVFDTVDILSAFESARRHCTERTRLLVVNYNPLWQPLLEFASKVGLRSPFIEPNWVSTPDLRVFLELAGFKPLRTHRTILCPKRIPLLSWLLDHVLARLPGIRRLCLMQVMVARPIVPPRNEEDISVSVIVPCRNEKGNIQPAVERIPEMGRHTEILFGDDQSTDGTADEVRRMQALYPGKDIRLISAPGICKAENVWTCFHAARGDVLMILDADLAVMPEELPSFLRAITGRGAEFINGSRLVYPIPRAAMKMLNRAGNTVFGWVFSFLLAQRIKDTLCGTKVLWREDWKRLSRNLGAWGLKDLWGDYELLFGAAKLHLEIAEVPVHYQERIYGATKMTRVFRNGLRMLGICWNAWRHLAP